MCSISYAIVPVYVSRKCGRGSGNVPARTATSKPYFVEVLPLADGQLVSVTKNGFFASWFLAITRRSWMRMRGMFDTGRLNGCTATTSKYFLAPAAYRRASDTQLRLGKPASTARAPL